MALQGAPYIYDISRLSIKPYSLLHDFAAWTMHFQIMMKERPTKFIFKVNHIFRISVLLVHVSAL
jgi:hypothetical protein